MHKFLTNVLKIIRVKFTVRRGASVAKRLLFRFAEK